VRVFHSCFKVYHLLTFQLCQSHPTKISLSYRQPILSYYKLELIATECKQGCPYFLNSLHYSTQRTFGNFHFLYTSWHFHSLNQLISPPIVLVFVLHSVILSKDYCISVFLSLITIVITRVLYSYLIIFSTVLIYPLVTTLPIHKLCC